MTKTRTPIILVAHNIRSLWNVGSFFRTADAFGVTHVHLTGYTPAPPRKEITKTAIGADEWIPWSKDEDVLAVIKQRKAEGYRVVALELGEKSIPIAQSKPENPVCIVVGHEILGVPEEVQKACDEVVHIPMLGRKKSLNVSVAAGIALFHYRSAGI